MCLALSLISRRTHSLLAKFFHLYMWSFSKRFIFIMTLVSSSNLWRCLSGENNILKEFWIIILLSPMGVFYLHYDMTFSDPPSTWDPPWLTSVQCGSVTEAMVTDPAWNHLHGNLLFPTSNNDNVYINNHSPAYGTTVCSKLQNTWSFWTNWNCPLRMTFQWHLKPNM